MTEEIVLSCLEEITGLDAAEFKEYENVHLLNEGIIDSLCLVVLVDMLSEKLHTKLTLDDFTRDDFKNVAALVKKIDTLCKK